MDLYDCLSLLFFFYLKSEDFSRLKSDWFKDVGNETILLKPEKTKHDRLKQETEHYSPDGYKAWKMIQQRRPDEFHCFPHLDRTKKEELKI